ncbi:MAG: hypothetical protein IT577_04315 [Verrucomicrobiae bacterium]|nr:hypothetical protein [Verrucomicrobiae bacterium]
MVQVQFDGEKIGAGSMAEGSVDVRGGSFALMPWLLDRGDVIDGGKFRIQMEHDAASGKAAGLKTVYRASLPKGLLAEVEGSEGAELRIETGWGSEAVGLAKLAGARAMDVLGGRVRLALLPGAQQVTGDVASEEFPSVAVLPDGGMAVAYVSWDGERDSILVWRGGKEEVVRGPGGDALDPRCVVDGEGRLCVVWAERDGKQWDLFGWREGKIARLTDGPGNDFWPRVARDGAGRAWVAWQSVGDDRHYEVWLGRWDGKALVDRVNVSESGADDWEPSICAAPDGRIVVAWDSYRNGSFDVYLREFSIDGGGAAKAKGGAVAIAATAAREAHATVASDRSGRVWIAWDVACENWGKHPGRAASLHSERGLDLACWSGGVIRRPGAGLGASLPDGFRKYSEYPQVAIDGKDRVWVIFRYQNRVAPKLLSPRGRAQSYGMWHEFAVQFDGSAWCEPLLLARSNGRQDVRPAVDVDNGGDLVVCYATDRRTREFPYKPVDYDVTRASLAGFGRDASAPRLADAPDLGKIGPVDPDPELASLPREWGVGGRNYRLVLGDTHRHTDISRCANGRDGSLQDAYRYALDACGLDWLAISDHDQDILRHRQDREERPRQLYDWWRSQKYCDLYSIPGRFVALYGYEHGGGYKDRGGHKNVVYADRGRPVFEQDAPEELFAALAGSGALAIPHQLADGASRTDWAKWNGEFERVAEIFQARGSYEFQGCPREAQIHDEGYMLWDALAKGVRVGIIASSDHGQTHEARAGVYVAAEGGFTRAGILGALRDRRAFGSTVAVSIRATVAGRPIGEEIELDAAPRLEAMIDAPAAIRRVEVVRDGAFVYAVEPGERSAHIQYTDIDLKPDASGYYYVRAQIGESDLAWTSPIWVRRRGQ